MTAKTSSRIKTELIAALDVQNLRSAEMMLRELKGLVSYYKVGLSLFAADGPRAIELIHKYGGQVFLDIKLHDGAQSAGDAVRIAARMGVFSISVNLSGGGKMLDAVEAVEKRPKLWGITVLTSMDHDDFKILGFRRSVSDMVRDLSVIGMKHRMDGIICSGHEAMMLRGKLGKRVHLIVAGVRPVNMHSHDHKRVITPGDAAKIGADFVIVGRPITEAPSPSASAERILKELKGR